ncbi:hypothetical protein [Prosthecobacter fluviatilis]|uniref:Lipoprotein n=1 Tax=Prosthecobacter fluviatilis TaxID=445931 RepID=A0ABW0KUU6_9BACT
MKRGLFFLTLAVCVLGAACAHAGTRMLAFIHQPLTTLGTDGDAVVVVARVPVLVNAVPESFIGAIAMPNRLPQSESAGMPDSNLVSLLHMGVSVQLVKGRHFRIVLDLQNLGDCEPYGVTVKEVVAGTVQCLQATFDEGGGHLGSYELSILPKKDDKTDWSPYEGRYEAKAKEKAQKAR